MHICCQPLSTRKTSVVVQRVSNKSIIRLEVSTYRHRCAMKSWQNIKMAASQQHKKQRMQLSNRFGDRKKKNAKKILNK